MNRCLAVKKKGSTEPCRTNALRGHTLCGRHAKMKTPLLWVDANMPYTPPITRIQALIRGWLIRRRLSYAGTKVLSRTNLANDDDIITCSDAKRVHPMNFFSFEENGKTWWFEFGSLWTWCIRNLQPNNPYTKVPLDGDTRKRLRTIWGYKRRHREDVPEESTDHDERLQHRANILVQHFEDYGFAGIGPSFLLHHSRSDLQTIFVLLHRDIETVIPASDPFRNRIGAICASRTHPNYASHSLYSLNCFSALLYIITLYRDPYIITFSILSALYRA